MSLLSTQFEAAAIHSFAWWGGIIGSVLVGIILVVMLIRAGE